MFLSTTTDCSTTTNLPSYAGGSPSKTSMVDPDTGTWTYEYDDLGRVTAQRDGNGRWLMYTRDVLGRQTRLFDGGRVVVVVVVVGDVAGLCVISPGTDRASSDRLAEVLTVDDPSLRDPSGFPVGVSLFARVRGLCWGRLDNSS